jgi:cold shock protein
MDIRVTGFVRWFSSDRGYGFAVLDNDETEEEFFIHFSAINMEGYKTLKAKQPISFILKKTDKGVQATEVELI